MLFEWAKGFSNEMANAILTCLSDPPAGVSVAGESSDGIDDFRWAITELMQEYAAIAEFELQHKIAMVEKTARFRHLLNKVHESAVVVARDAADAK